MDPVRQTEELAQRDWKQITWKEINANKPKDIFEKIDRILINIYILNGEPTYFSVDQGSEFTRNIFYANNEREGKSVVILLENMGCVDLAFPGKYFRPEGYKRLYEVKRELSRSKKCFIAMWFDEKQDSVYDAIERAVVNCGYEPIRIDKKEHNELIVPEIFLK